MTTATSSAQALKGRTSKASIADNWRRPQRRMVILLCLPAFVLLGVLVGWPIVDGVLLSLQRITPTAEPGWVWFRNYQAVLGSGMFWHTLFVTLMFTVISLVIELGLGMALALMLARVVRGAGAIRTLILVPVMLTPSVAAINFRVMLNYDYGLVNYLLRVVGLQAQPWVSQAGVGPLLSLVMTDVWRSTPFFVLVLSSGLLALPQDVLEAADVDGARMWRKLLLVKIPMLAPLLLVTVLFRVIDLFRTFDIVYVLTQGGPGTSTTVTSLLIYNDMAVGNFTSYAATEAVIFMVLMLFVSILLIRSLRAQE
jgi:multiple sugar transport system permease protein